MGYDEFLGTLSDPEPPADLELALRALWFDANGRDDSALRTVAHDANHYSKRVRAYLLRKAGDVHGSQLWYWRAGVPRWSGSARSEWEDIVKTVLTDRVVNDAYT